jgi:hypothetical protein
MRSPCNYFGVSTFTFHLKILFKQPVRLAGGWCWFVTYCWLIAGGWFVLREKYCWLVADKPNEMGKKSRSNTRGIT